MMFSSSQIVYDYMWHTKQPVHAYENGLDV